MTTTGNHVIFVHPDGASPSHFALARFVDLGPDGRLNWDNLDHAGVYLGHMEDQLLATSNGGAVTHATGAKVFSESFGFEADGSPITSLAGTETTIVEDAIAANKVTALVQSGSIVEPGTAAFVARTVEIEVDGNRISPRSQAADIARQVIESGVDFIMGGGELNLLPVGTDGFHGTAEELDALSTNPIVRPSENLIELAQSLGYTVVYTEEDLRALLDLETPPTKVLGVFAPNHTFNDLTEEVLAERGLPLYVETAPTIAEMLEVTQALMKLHPNFDNGSIAILEEEGTDNFANQNNASGTLEAVRRSDAAIGVALDFVEENPNTLIITAADSDAGGLQVRDPRTAGRNVGTINNNPTTEPRPVPMDGVTGADTLPFTAAPDASGNVFNFAVTWAGTPDFSGSIVSKAHGLNAERLPATLDNTKIYELMYETLFEVELEARNPDPAPAPEPTANTGNVIFIHPDGAGPSHFMAARMIDLGPDGRLNWDMMTDAGVYLGHMDNRLTATSNAAAVTHANGVRVFNESFGLNEDNTPITPASARVGKTIFEEAIEAGKATALIQSGHMAEPGTAAFVAQTTNRDGDNINARAKFAEINEQVIRSGTNVIMGGGELHLLPIGTTGFHVTPEIDASETRAERRPTINLIELAKSLGYTVVYTEQQMFDAVNQATPPEKLLGVFAATNTFNDLTEEVLAERGLPLYVETAPTVGEMLEASLVILEQDPDGFFVVLEEEGTDNFANQNNALGTIEAARRSDAAIGVAMDFVDNQDPNTLVLTTADSDAGGIQVFQFVPHGRPSGNSTSDPNIADEEPSPPFIVVNPTTTRDNVAVLDGAEGSTGSPERPWISFSPENSIDGPMGNFGIAWVGTPDVPGSIVSKAYGMNADLLPSTHDNTEIYKLMYQTLFGLEGLTVNGRGGNDTLVGGFLNDTIIGHGGDDHISGNNGDDVLNGSIGNDFVSGGAGADNLFGAAGDDTINGHCGNDTINGGNDNNLIDGGDGDDSLVALGGDDTIVGGMGNDIILGRAGNDSLAGGEGNDNLKGGVAHDFLYGGDGVDTLTGANGNDTLVGGLGNDILNAGIGLDVFRFNSSGEGIDTIINFSVSDDIIEVSASGFGGGLSLGTLGEDHFVIGSAATTADHRFIYDSRNGYLFFDNDGNGANEAIQIASLRQGLALTNQNIEVI